jgi:chloride channel protein, CIC family
MKWFSRNISIRTFRRQLASIDSIPQFALLGVCSGLLTGLVIVVFRQMVEIPLRFLLPDNVENFEGLDWPYYFFLPLAGGVALAIIISLIKPDSRLVGVVHVMQRLGRHQGHLPASNLFTQMVTGTIALATGQSGGREGPAIHLGAAGSSLLGQYLNLPNNSIRILVGCGAAAAIAGSFNTPIAGVIFSMEVIIMEYTIAGFIPVILAAVVAALINQMVYGSDTAFQVPAVSMSSFHDLPLLIAEGIFIGIIAAIYVRVIQMIYGVAPNQLWLRLMIAALVTGVAALAVPQVLGVGYDTVDSALLGDLPVIILLAACLFKLLTSATSVAMGMPIGLIGPTLFIGATAGGLVAVVANYIDADLSSPAFYVMLGMGAMMGAVLQAPLAALMAVMEMTHNPNIILPAMLVIIIANVTASEVFGLKSVFMTQMDMMGIEFRQNPLSMALNRASVASIMSRSFQRVPATIDLAAALELKRTNPHWLLVDGDQHPREIIRTEDLILYLSENSDVETIDLGEIPATRRDVTSILLQATLSEALDSLNHKGVQALYVNRITGPLMDSPVGILTREDIETFYQN